jgi:hypothetical protein
MSARTVSYDRYGMDNEDWYHLNEYWRTMYGADYPRGQERRRGHQYGEYREWRPKHYRTGENRQEEHIDRAA